MTGLPLRSFSGALIAIAAFHTESAEAKKPVTLEWMVVSSLATKNPVTLEKGQSTSFAAIAPRDVAKLSTSADGKNAGTVIPAGTILAWADKERKIACEPNRRGGNFSVFCLEDSDGDLAFDSYYKVPSITWGFYRSEYTYLIGTFEVSRKNTLSKTIPFETLEKNTMFEPITMNLVFTGNNGPNRQGLSFCVTQNQGKNIWGGSINITVCGPSFPFKELHDGMKISQSGGTITIVRKEEKTVIVSMSAPKPGFSIN